MVFRSSEEASVVTEDLLIAVDDTRYSRNDDLYDIVGSMIVVRGVRQPDSINEIRNYVNENIAELIYRGTSSIEIAKQLRTIVSRRVADFFRKKKRALSLAGSRVVSLDQALESGEDVRDPVGTEDMVLRRSAIRILQRAISDMRASSSEHDRRDALLLEAYLDDVPARTRMREAFDKDISDEYAATLLYRAKQKLKRRLINEGIRGDEI